MSWGAICEENWPGCPRTVVHSLARVLRQESRPGHLTGHRCLYWIAHNDWDKLRSMAQVHPTLAKIPYIRKFFWESLEMAERFEWEHRIKELEELLAPYKNQRDADMALVVQD